MAWKSRESFQQLDKAQAWEKIRPYCAYQERCHSEVKEKLFGFGMNAMETDELISRLIEEGYLNEERFATQFAGGHFRLKKWGKVKITHALKQKQVSAYCIKKAMTSIDDEAYETTAEKLLQDKMRLLKGGRQTERNFKCKQFLLQRGFEGPLIDRLLKKAGGSNDQTF